MNKFQTAFEKGIVGPYNQQGMKYIKENGCKILEIKIMGISGDLRLYGEVKKDENGIRYCEINQLKKTHEKDFVISI
jgi:maleate cis-trans isomerase